MVIQTPEKGHTGCAVRIETTSGAMIVASKTQFNTMAIETKANVAKNNRHSKCGRQSVTNTVNITNAVRIVKTVRIFPDEDHHGGQKQAGDFFSQRNKDIYAVQER